MNPAKWLLCWLADVHFLGHSCNLILTRIFTFNFNAAVKPEQKIKEEENISSLLILSSPLYKIFQLQSVLCL